jgi:cytochrome c oxidase subunit III
VTRPIEIRADVSRLPDYAFGPAALGWWGTIGFMLIEGMAFVLAVGTYLYLIPFERHWPPAPPPELRYGTAFTLLMIASLVPNYYVLRAARRQELRQARRGLLVMIAIAFALLVLRGFEFTTLNVHWTDNAYGSIVWAIMLIHTTHLATDAYDSLPLVVLLYTRETDGRRFSDVEDNALYWNFVALAWLPLYALLYWLPRWL